MAFLQKIKGRLAGSQPHPASAEASISPSFPVAVPADAVSGEKGIPDPASANVTADRKGSHSYSPDLDAESFTSDAQEGVKAIEAITTVWSRNELILAYALIWIFFSIDTLAQQLSNGVVIYVTSGFAAHGLTATIGVVSNIIGGLTKLPLAKVLDIWGRPQGFAMMVFILTIGLIMMAASNGVTTYAAAQVFYWVGQNGVQYTLSIFIADTSSLRNRAFMVAFLSSPYLFTTWAGGPLAQAFIGDPILLDGPGWRWGYGTFCIVIPIAAVPIWYLFWRNQRKAENMGLLKKEPSGRTIPQSIYYYVVEFDLFGLLLLCAGLALFLLPFSLYSRQPGTWGSPLVICFWVFGILLIIGFALWEKFGAPKTFIPYDLLTDRTVLGACCLSGLSFISFYCWDSFFISFLQVVNRLSITNSSYVGYIYTLGSCLWSFAVGLAIRSTGRFKWCALYFGLPMSILGTGLMIHFRQPNVNVGFLVMCQIFIAVGGGTNVICQQIAAMAAASHQHVAVVLAVEGMFSSIGGAIGSSISAAIWNSVFPDHLKRNLPAESQPHFAEIYAAVPSQLLYGPPGSETQAVIQRAYADAQRYMLIAGTLFYALGIVAVLFWRDIKVKDFKQVKGRVV